MVDDAYDLWILMTEMVDTLADVMIITHVPTC